MKPAGTLPVKSFLNNSYATISRINRQWDHFKSVKFENVSMEQVKMSHTYYIR